jgi:anti-anti-sigma factor
LRTRTHKDVLVITFVDSDLSADELVHGIRVELLAAVLDPTVRKVVLDLHEVRYLGSGAMRPFLTLKHKLKERGGQVVLCGLTPMLAEVFRVTRLIEQQPGMPGLFDCVADVPAALAWLDERAG